jgi:hypothetical protein
MPAMPRAIRPLRTRAPLVALLAVLASAPAPAGDNTPGVMPLNSKVGGLTYGEWSARHWQWEYSMPVDKHPLFGTAAVSEGQSGEVWFLGGTFASTELEPGVFVGMETRDVTIPPGKKLFFPVIDAEASAIEGDSDGYGGSEAELRATAEFFADFIVPESLYCEVDGKRVKNLADYRVQSPLFTFGPLPDNNILESFGYDAPEGSTSDSVSDGVFVMLAPLSAGKHTVRFGGVIDLRDAGGPVFVQAINYNITVKN